MQVVHRVLPAGVAAVWMEELVVARPDLTVRQRLTALRIFARTWAGGGKVSVVFDEDLVSRFPVAPLSRAAGLALALIGILNLAADLIDDGKISLLILPGFGW